MFTGIIEVVGIIDSIEEVGSNIDLWVTSDISPELKIDQSVSHNGVCLTVVELREGAHRVTAVEETLRKSNLGELQESDRVNLERSMVANGRFDGHIVQGHVDTLAKCVAIVDQEGSWRFTFAGDTKLLVEKGSICINGISLTCFDVGKEEFSVAIIPYTFEHTNMHSLSVGDSVNLEFDIVGKYVQKLLG